MPELPEVETIARGLLPLLENRTIQDLTVNYPGSIRGGKRKFKLGLSGRTILSVRRRAKLLLINLEEGFHLLFHLKMTGRTLVVPERESPDKHTHVEFHLDDGQKLIFHDQRKFGYCMCLPSHELDRWEFYRSLGPEPLEMSTDEFISCFAGRKARIKSLLLNQQVIAGIGNIYADESLFQSGIHPASRASHLSFGELEKLHKSLRQVLSAAIDQGGSSFRDYVNALGVRGSFQESFSAYGRKGLACARCGQVLQTAKVAGRTSTFCPCCQPCKGI